MVRLAAQPGRRRALGLLPAPPARRNTCSAAWRPRGRRSRVAPAENWAHQAPRRPRRRSRASTPAPAAAWPASRSTTTSSAMRLRSQSRQGGRLTFRSTKNALTGKSIWTWSKYRTRTPASLPRPLGTEPWACGDCDCTDRLEARLPSEGEPFVEVLRRGGTPCRQVMLPRATLCVTSRSCGHRAVVARRLRARPMDCWSQEFRPDVGQCRELPPILLKCRQVERAGQ